MNEKDLQDQLKRPSLPKELEASIRENWKQQLAQSHEIRRQKRFRLVGVAASVAIVTITLIVVMTLQTPTVVRHALADIEKDKPLNVGIAVPDNIWMSSLRIKAPPAVMAIDMTKYCYIEGAKTVHFQLSGADHSEVHLFVQDGEFEKRSWQTTQGELESMKWRLLKPRDDLSILVLFSRNADTLSIERLIDTMFFA
ncbi:DUF3379 family protein [Kaarinaea lacus]